MKVKITVCVIMALFFGFGQIVAQTNTYSTNAGNANGSFNSGFGLKVLRGNTSVYNTAVGAWAMANGADDNIANGTITGAYNNAFGGWSLLNNTTGSSNNSIGYRAMQFNLSGGGNNVMGMDALVHNVSGYHNVAIGSNALQYNNPNLGTAGGYNIAIGVMAGQNNGSGIGNIFIGSYAGQYEMGSDNLYIHNTNTASPLIYGAFGTRNLKFNGNVEINSNISNNTSGLKFSDLTSSYTPTTTATKFLTVNSTGDVILQNIPSGSGGSTAITAGTNITVTGDATAGYTISSPTTVVNSINSNQLITTVNGIASAPVAIPALVEVDGDVANELQTLTQTGNTVTLSQGGGSFNFPAFIDTNDQTLSLAGNVLSIQNGNSVTLPTLTEVDGSISNELQTLTQTGNTVTLSQGGGSFNFPAFIDTNDQTLSLTGNVLSIQNGNSVTLPTLTEVDGSTTNELSNLALNGNVLTLTNPLTPGNSVILPAFTEVDGSVTNELQTLGLTGNNLTISNGNTIALPLTQVIAGNNVTVVGTGVAGNPYIISATTTGTGAPDINIYKDNGTLTSNRLVTMGTNKNLIFNTAGSTPTTGGRIYIGNTTAFTPANFRTNTGDYRLYVEGGIMTEKVKVARRSTVNWADYVFASDYKLMPLKDVETFIKANKHLPGVSSAEELVKDGLDLGDMQAKQMEKIEELTLYVIQQNKQLEKQDKEIEELKSLVKNLIDKK